MRAELLEVHAHGCCNTRRFYRVDLTGWHRYDIDLAKFDKAFDPNQPRDEGGKWTAGGGSVSRTVAEALGVLETLPATDYKDFPAEGEEISVRDIWPGSADVPMVVGIGGKNRGSGWEEEVEIDPRAVFPAQSTVLRDAVAEYLKNPSKQPLGQSEGDDTRPRVAFYDKYDPTRPHVVAGHHRLAAAALRGEAVKVLATYAVNTGSFNRPVRQVKVRAWHKQYGKAFDPSQPRDDRGRWSSSGGSGPAPSMSAAFDAWSDREHKMLKAKAVAQELGFDPDKVQVGETGRTFELNGQRMNYAGAAYPDGHIEIFPEAIQDEGAIGGIVAHEVMHERFNAFQAAYDAEQRKLVLDPRPTNELMRADGSLLTPALEREFPAYTAQQKVNQNWQKMQESDGVTKYSREYWKAYEAGTGDGKTAVNETLAEMARVGYETGVYPGTREWNEYRRAVVKYGKLK